MPPKKRPRLSSTKGKKKKAGGPDLSFPNGFFPLTPAAQAEKDAAAAEKQRLLEEGRLERDRLVVQSVPGQLPAPADLYEDEAVAVRESAIEGLGLFARRPFKAGEAVLTWRPKRLSEAEFRDTPAPLRRYLGVLDDGTKVLMQSPERYVNSAAEPNTCTAGESDVALRDIEAGEELTSSYPLKEL